jgi:hypothetical protein
LLNSCSDFAFNNNWCILFWSSIFICSYIARLLFHSKITDYNLLFLWDWVLIKWWVLDLRLWSNLLLLWSLHLT